MANQIAIDIYLRDGSEVQSTPTGTAGDTARGITAGGVAGNNVPKDVNEQGAKQLATYVKTKTIDVFVNNVKAGLSQNIGIVTGKKELQQRVNFVTGTASGITNLISNMAQGGAIAKAVGFSSTTGNIVALVLSLASFGINTAFNAQNLQIQENLENMQIQQTYTRAGASFNKSRSGT